jgi:predicted AAA+ superfamily ATPase
VPAASPITLDDLKNIDRQKGQIEPNTRQFVQRKPANNVLLTGARGTGKSSLIKACLNAYANDGLRLIEVDKDDLGDLGDIVELISQRPERFIVFCDDLSFEDGESGYKALKVALDGSVAAQSDNVLIYATSNRRHLLPEYMKDNETYKHLRRRDPSGRSGGGEDLAVRALRPVGRFYPFKQDEYLDIVGTGCATSAARTPRSRRARRCAGLGARARFALGRVAWQFARDWSGRKEQA